MPIATKTQILEAVHEQLYAKISMLQTAIVSAKESRDNDTKSSAGDKYETGREMIQAEINKNQGMLSKTLLQQNEIARISPSHKYNKVAFGSLVQTTKGTFLIAVGLGRIEDAYVNCFVISLVSPIGKLLNGKTVGDTVKFNNKILRITEIC